MYPPTPPPPPAEKIKVGFQGVSDIIPRAMYYDLTTIQVDLIQMDYYPADGCAINPAAFLFTIN